MLDDDPLDYVCRVLAGVNRLLEQGVDVLPLDDVHRLLAVFEQLGDRLPRNPVALVLEAMDFNPVLLEALEGAQLGQRFGQLLALACDDLGLRSSGVGGRLDEVQDVVEAADQAMDVLAVEGRDEGRFQLVPDLMADLVTRVLCITQLAGQPFAVVVIAEELLEQASRPKDVVGVLDEHVEELRLARNQRDAHRSPGGCSGWKPRPGGLRCEGYWFARGRGGASCQLGPGSAAHYGSPPPSAEAALRRCRC